MRVKPRSNHEAVVAALFDAGSMGVHEDGDSFVTNLADDCVERLRQRVATIDPGATVANILSSVISSMLPVIARSLAPDGEVILSGIMVEEREMMLVRLAEGGWRVTVEESEGEWWAAVAVVSR